MNMADAHIDLDVLGCSVWFNVSCFRRNSVSSFEIVKALLHGGIPAGELKSVFRYEESNSWLTTVSSKSEVDRIVTAGTIEREQFTLQPEPGERRRVTIRLQCLPSWMSDDAIARHFDGFYEKVVNVAREMTDTGRVALEKVTRVITLVIREGEQDGISHRMKICGKTALIAVPY